MSVDLPKYEFDSISMKTPAEKQMKIEEAVKGDVDNSARHEVA